LIRHLVLIRFRSNFSKVEKEKLFEAFSVLKNQLKVIRDLRVRANVSFENHVKHNFNDALVLDFDDVAARDAYLIDPRHQAVGAQLVLAAEGGLNGIVVFDMEV
jgi:Stress responsive A/B Barrel Domain